MATLRALKGFVRTAELIEAVGFAEVLTGPGAFTVFAPSSPTMSCLGGD